jgi:tRNA A37 threonylcarbamoyladenosine dehydratase
VGCVKVEVMAERLKRINPDAKIEALKQVFNYKTAKCFNLASYDYVLDAIDSLSPKVDLIQTTLSLNTTLFSAMGASCKLDPTRIRVGSFWKVTGCPLAKKVRKRLRKRGVNGDFIAVFSDELLEPFDVALGCGTGDCFCPKVTNAPPDTPVHEWCSAKKQINGSAIHITAPFGFYLSWLVYRDVTSRCGERPQERGRGSQCQARWHKVSKK